MASSHFLLRKAQCWGPAYPVGLRRGLGVPRSSSSCPAGSVPTAPEHPILALFHVLVRPEITRAEAVHPSPADVGSGKMYMTVKPQLTLTQHLRGANKQPHLHDHPWGERQRPPQRPSPRTPRAWHREHRG